MGRRRNKDNLGLPPNLYKRKDFYYFRDPRTKIEYSLGKNRTLAITETIEANLAILKPKASLVNRINNVEVITLHLWLDKFSMILEKRGLKPKSLRDYKSRLKIIKDNLPNVELCEIMPKDIHNFISNYERPTMAKFIRATLSDAFKEAITSGIIETNPVTVTKPPKIIVKRERLSLDMFSHIVSHCPDLFRPVFLFALITGQRIGDILKLEWKDIKNNRVYIVQQKTGVKIAIPLDLYLGAIDMTLNDVIKSVPKLKKKVFLTNANVLRKVFNDLLPISDNKPTFHEIRSLTARIYKEEKGEGFASKLLGHKSMYMTSKYLDERNNDFIEL